MKKYTVKLAPLVSVCTTALLLGGCMVGPTYVRPQVTVPAQYKEQTREQTRPASREAAQETHTHTAAPDIGWTQAQPDDNVLRGPWWKIFGDPQLDHLEDQVNVSNQNVQKAIALLDQARSGIDFAHAGFSPSVGVGAATSRTHYSDNVVDSAKSGNTISDYATALDVSWEPDLWGKIRHTVDAARANEQASAADLEGVRLSMHAELAVDYFNLRGVDASAKLLADTTAAFEQTVQLTTNRFNAGIASQSDVAQAQTQLEATQAQELDLGVMRARYEHAIATLIGQPASLFSLPSAQADFTPPDIPLGIPSQLLQRRPDVAAAERQMAAANAQIGVAQAAFYPDLLLAASGGAESSALSSLLTAPSRMWTIAPALIAPLFDGGARRATLHGAQAQFAANAADYKQTVLSAFQEVEDNLAALRILQQEAAKQDEAVKSAELALSLELNQYRIGSVGYLDVVTAQSTALANERLEVDLMRRRMDASVQLIKALGGSWQGLGSQAGVSNRQAQG